MTLKMHLPLKAELDDDHKKYPHINRRAEIINDIRQRISRKIVDGDNLLHYDIQLINGYSGPRDQTFCLQIAADINSDLNYQASCITISDTEWFRTRLQVIINK